MKTIIVNNFNTNVLHFLEQLNHINNNLFDNNIIKCKLIIKLNNKLLINKFYENIYKYNNLVHTKNYNILYKLQELEIFDNINLIEIWNILSDKDKNVCWDFLEVFILLCDKYYLNK